MADLKIPAPFTLKGANTRSISLAKNHDFDAHSKHIDVHYHYTREQLEKKLFFSVYVPNGYNLAELFTKGLDKMKHQLFCSKIYCDSPWEGLKSGSHVFLSHLEYVWVSLACDFG